MMDWFIINYFVKTKLVSDESIGNLVAYLNIVTNIIRRFYEEQSVRNTVLRKILKEHGDQRQNKARENYRIMKKWKIQVEVFKDQEKFVEDLLAELTQQKNDDETTIDTEILKRNDCIMKHFVRKNKKSTSQKMNDTTG